MTEETKEEKKETKKESKQETKRDPVAEAEALFARLREGMDVYTGKSLLAAAIVAAEARYDELDKLGMSDNPKVAEQLAWRKRVLQEIITHYKAV